MITNLAVGTSALLATLNLAMALRYRRCARGARLAETAAQAEWNRANGAATIAMLQAKAVGDSAELLCDDCRRIVGGNYEATAGPVRAWLNEQRP